MRGIFTVLAVVCAPIAGNAQAQSSQCQWIGRIWTCNEITPLRAPQSGIQWNQYQTPDVVGNAMRAYEEGRQARQERERARLEAEALTAHRDYYRSQTPLPTQQGKATGLIPAKPTIDYKQAWLAAASPRMHLFPDFNQVVFSPDVSISDEMVMLMAGSPYAADIAYHLATHRLEARAIYAMQPLDAARAIGRLEDEVRAREPKPAGSPP